MSRDNNKMSEMTKYKREIIRMIYSNPDIIEILDCDQVDPEQPDTAEWVVIYPYARIPETQEEVGTFICVMTNIPEIYEENDLFAVIDLNITVICARDRMRVTQQKGSRTDIIAGDITEMLNHNNTFGYTTRLVSDIESVVNSYYCARSLVFRAIRRNNLVRGRKLY